MSQPTRSAAWDQAEGVRADPRLVADLLDVLADNNIDHALSDIEQVIARLRTGADKAAVARETLRTTPTRVMQEALRLRAARIEAGR